MGGKSLNPRQVIADSVSLTYRYAVFVFELMKRKHRVGANSSNRLPVKFGLMIFVASLPSIIARCFSSAVTFCYSAFAAPFRAISINHIAHIVCLSSEDEMVGINAGGGVAGVTHNHAFGYWPIKQVIGDSRPVKSIAIDRIFNAGVSARTSTASVPYPASILVNSVFCMKSLNVAVFSHNKCPVGVFLTHYTGKGGNCGR